MNSKFLSKAVKLVLSWKLVKFVLGWKLGAGAPPTAAMEDDHQNIFDRPQQPALPQSYPLRTLRDLEELSRYLDSFHFPFNQSSVPLPVDKRIGLRGQHRPRLLVCHDMKGGYQDDRWVQGSPNSDAYSIWHWHLLDIFVYFSHSLVTLPPPCWINAAHRHGVQVLGTFITEWDEGEAICRTLLSSKESIHLYASRLAKLAEVLGFDGWLINIENKIDKHQVDNLSEFVRLLTRFMHEMVPGSTVIWYDSVTKDGELSWQDSLNGLNKCFFDQCDGIFTNYTWKESYPKRSAAMAGESRRYDVYMGIDVFGRNTYGGGGFQSNVALKAARAAGVSAALFAPGWVYETQQSPSFISAQNRWWGLVAECWPSAQQYPMKLPLFSNFNQGFWKAYYQNGIKISTAPGSNISCQNLQPLLRVEGGSLKATVECQSSGERPAFSGGAWVQFSGSVDEESYCLTTLYEANIEVDTPFTVSYSARTNHESSMSLVLRMATKGSIMYVVLDAGGDFEQSPSSTILAIGPRKATQNPQGWILLEYKVETTGHLEAILAVSYSNKQRISDLINKVHFAKPAHSSKEGKLSKKILTTCLYEACLGHIAISSTNHEHNLMKEDEFEGPLKVSDVFWDEVSGKRVVSLKLSWKREAWLLSQTIYDHVYASRGGGPLDFEYLGVAMVGAFYVFQLEAPESCQTLTVCVQAVCECGYSRPLDECPVVEIRAP